MAVQVRRVQAGNASAMTGTGTNSYLVGSGSVVVIDPGPQDSAHLAALLAALSPGEKVAAILVSHAHLDHSALAPRLAQATGAATHAFGPAEAGRSALMQALVADGLQGGGEGVDRQFAPDHLLTDGQVLQIGALAIEILHTPGHMGGHLCFACDGVLFSGDHVMGWASSLISPPDGDMAAYMASLERLAPRPWRQMLPGHGDPIAAPAQRIAELIAHRRGREREVLAALSQAPGTADALAARIYHDIPPKLLPAAGRSVLAHLIDLSERKIALPEGPIRATTVFHPA